jgi:hypothetical protein
MEGRKKRGREGRREGGREGYLRWKERRLAGALKGGKRGREGERESGKEGGRGGGREGGTCFQQGQEGKVEGEKLAPFLGLKFEPFLFPHQEEKCGGPKEGGGCLEGREGGKGGREGKREGEREGGREKRQPVMRTIIWRAFCGSQRTNTPSLPAFPPSRPPSLPPSLPPGRRYATSRVAHCCFSSLSSLSASTGGI